MNKKLSELFEKCAYRPDWQTVGHDVNYQFDEEGDTLYIYFQGSKDIKAENGWWDWVRNFWFFPKFIRPYEDMKYPYKVHGGFLAAWDEVKNIIKEKIMEVDKNSPYIADPEAQFNENTCDLTSIYRWKEIIIVGYSHGGALSGLCHEFCQYWRKDLHEKDLIHGYGFESPRFLHCYRVPKELKPRWKNYYIIRNGSDIVTHCPPWLLCFCHVGEMIKIKGDTKLVENKMLKCIKYHFPQVVLDGLKKYEDK